MVRTTLFLSLVIASGCQPPPAPAEETRAETIGVIEEVEMLGGTRHRFTLDSGDVVEFDPNDTPPLGSTTPFPGQGMLLFLGEGQEWYTTAEPVGDCYEMTGWVGDHDGEAMLGTGLILELSPRVSMPIGGGSPSEWVGVCVDAEGRYIGVCDEVDGGCSVT